MSFDARFVDQARRDLNALLAANPELEEDEVLRLDMIEGTTNALHILDMLIQAERNTLGLEDAIEQEIDRLKKRQDRFTHRRAAIRKYIMQIMESANLKKVERPAATVSISAGRPKVVIMDEKELPMQFFRIKKEPDKEAIKNALVNGDYPIPGATLSNPEPVLRIS
jgi:hypothetical protein